MRDALFTIAGSLGRGKGNFSVTLGGDGKNEFALVAGAPTAVSVKGGVVVTLGVTRDRLVELKKQIEELLVEEKN